jgi:hypothetical protein
MMEWLMRLCINNVRRYIFLLLLFSSALALSAHEPADIAVKYSALTGSLNITIYHKVNSISVHYVNRLEIYLNRQGLELQDKLIIRQEFLNQPTRNEQRAQYTVNGLNPNDVLRIVAYCSLFGQREDKLTITTENWQELLQP